MTEPKPLPRLLPFYVAAGAGVAGLALAIWLARPFSAEIAANVFFAAYLGLSFWQLPKLTASVLRHHADAEDAPVGVIFLVTVIVVIVAVVSLFLAINSAALEPWRLVLALFSVVLGWFMVHTMAAHHYAHEYYQPDPAGTASSVGGKSRPNRGGLAFPGGEAPDGLAFLYFAYVVGMTAQVADVPVLSARMRRLTLVQSVFAFFFNTVIVAAAVNIAVSLRK